MMDATRCHRLECDARLESSLPGAQPCWVKRQPLLGCFQDGPILSSLPPDSSLPPSFGSFDSLSAAWHGSRLCRSLSVGGWLDRLPDSYTKYGVPYEPTAYSVYSVVGGRTADQPDRGGLARRLASQSDAPANGLLRLVLIGSTRALPNCVSFGCHWRLGFGGCEAAKKVGPAASAGCIRWLPRRPFAICCPPFLPVCTCGLDSPSLRSITDGPGRRNGKVFWTCSRSA